jgi:hypothetical protein
MEDQGKPVLSDGLERRRPSGYASETAGLLSANRNMLIAIVFLCAAMAGSLYVNYLDRLSWRQAKVNFVGIQKDGSLVTLDADMFNFPVTDATLRAALINFMQHHMERVKGRVAEDYAFSLQFLHKPLRDRLAPRDRVNIKSVMEGMAEEVRITVKSVSLRNMRGGCEKTDCGASVIVKKNFFRGAVSRETQSTVELSFRLRPGEVTQHHVQSQNPMGLVITEFQEYPYFESDDTAPGFRETAMDASK